MTASSVASEYFQNELNLCHALSTTQQTHAAVILSDACYGHRYSRPKTSRAALSTIVERPERIKAGALGVAMAYVRLGGRHCDGDYPAHPKLDPTSIPTVPFKIHKTTRKLPLLSPAVTNVHGSKWMEELRTMCRLAESKLAMGGKELARPESGRTGDTGAAAKLHEGDLYLCADSLDALEGALGAVCEAVDLVFSDGPRRAFVAVRPPGHHCSASYPSGFCWVNNVHVGVMHAALTHGLTHAAIIDFDLHHGDGSQSIAWQHNTRGVSAAKNAQAWKKTSIGYFSLHDINSYPCEMGDEEKVKNASLCIENAHGQNMWNVHLHSWGSEAEFWKLYETKYTVILEKTRSYLQQQAARLRANGQTPKAAIFFSAGFDASEWETKGMQRHNVNVPTEFYARITQDVIRIAAEEGLGVDGRVVSVLEGGYSDRALFSGIFSHVCGLAAHPPSDDLDKITTGMKKIKINLITKSQKEERARSSQAAAAAAAATAAAPVTRTEPGPAGNQSAPRSASEFLPQPDVAQPPVVDETTSALAVEESAETQPALTVKPEIGAHEGPVSAQLPLSSDVPEHKILPTHSFARPASSQKAQQDGADQSPALELTSNTSPEMFVAYQAEGPAPMSVPQQGSLRWLPPNTSTPATARRTDLPVFTSTSAIPFAVAQKPSQSTAHEEDLKETGAKREHPREG
ncbi:Histone deacetylase HOS3 like protein [Verticillium longisporum]|uniref:Histone deacetylase HOS3 like protein n=1 Tax=Verticillium longisporum TaxID=100787 RepID=A0A8I3APS1_VERLO|nr:Histone deacetylase HOS3 like protein [Verticillium longisporum]